MRLTKTMYIVHEKKEIIDYDPLGNPIYETVKTYEPIKCEIEPFSSKLAEESYGVFIDATNRAFTYPNDLIKLDEKVELGKKEYKVTEIIKYDTHFETMLKEVGDVDEK